MRRLPKVPVQCLWCGKRWLVPPSWAGKKYCSAAHYHAAITQPPAYPPCATCGGEITGRQNSRSASKNRTYCAACQYKRVRVPEAVRFYRHVDLNSDAPCHRWIGGLGSTGHGFFNTGAGTRLAHRVAFRLWYGREARAVLHHRCHHRCHHRWCVNPAHLQELDSQGDHIQAHYEERLERVYEELYLSIS